MQGKFIERIRKFDFNVISLLCHNPGPFTLQGSNVYLIGNSNKRLLIDTGQGKDLDKEMLVNVLKEENCTIDRILLTHHHPDHIGGIDFIKEFNPTVEIFAHPDFPIKIGSCNKIKDSDIFEIDDLKLQAIYSPGHCDDHIAFFEINHRILFTGDLVLGQGSNTINDISKYFESMQKMINLSPEFLHCAHGLSIIGKEKCDSHLQHNYEHRKKRDSQILKALETCHDINELLETVYPGLQENLKRGAIQNIIVHCKPIAHSESHEFKEKAKLIIESSKI